MQLQGGVGGGGVVYVMGSNDGLPPGSGINTPVFPLRCNVPTVMYLCKDEDVLFTAVPQSVRVSASNANAGSFSYHFCHGEGM